MDSLLLFYFNFIGFLIFLSNQKQQSEYHKNELQVWASMKEGITYIYRTKEILGALCLDMFAVLFGGAVAMIPVFASDILKSRS